MSLSDLDRLDALTVAGPIAKREISPVEVTERSLARLAETESVLNAFVAVDHDGAMQQAKRAELAVLEHAPLGPLHGVPVSVKDLVDVAGLPARYGSLTLKDNVAKQDAPAVARLRDAGAIIIGKTTTSEFGARGFTQSLVHGDTANPWDTSRTPGGSSGGAVASVAAGVTAIAIGTDGGGSIRAPSALTGLVGIKGTFGRVPVWPASATPTLAHVGPIARTVNDASAVLRVIAGPDLRDPFSLYPPFDDEPREESVRNLRVAFSPTLGYARVDRPVADVIARAIKTISTIWPNIEPVDAVCPDPSEILGSEFIGGCSARLGDQVDQNPELIDPVLLKAIKEFRQIGSDKFSRVVRRRLEHRETLRTFFERYDLLLTPTTPCVGWTLRQGVPPGHEDAATWSYFTYPFNLGHQPAATLPCGLADGMPVGLQFVYGLLQEPRLIAALRLAERELGSPVHTPIDINNRGRGLAQPGFANIGQR